DGRDRLQPNPRACTGSGRLSLSGFRSWRSRFPAPTRPRKRRVWPPPRGKIGVAAERMLWHASSQDRNAGRNLPLPDFAGGYLEVSSVLLLFKLVRRSACWLPGFEGAARAISPNCLTCCRIRRGGSNDQIKRSFNLGNRSSWVHSLWVT